MRVTDLDAIPVNTRFATPEISSITAREGITQTLVKIVTDHGAEVLTLTTQDLLVR